MRIIPALIVLCSALTMLWGCGSGTEPPPSQAVMHGVGKPPATAHKGAWTKDEMIAAVEKAPIPEDQKKAEIAKINAMPAH